MEGLAIVLAVLNSLSGAPSFDVRERCTAGPPYALLLIHSTDPEVVHRHWPASREFYWQQLGPIWDARGWPWVDSIPDMPWAGCEIPQIPGDDWPGYKEATRLWAKQQIEKGVRPADLERRLLEAEQRTNYWRQHKRYP